MTPGIGPEGFAIAPDGKTAATPLLLGTAAKDSDWFKTKAGELALMSIGTGGKLTVTARAPLGGPPEDRKSTPPNSSHTLIPFALFSFHKKHNTSPASTAD